MHAVQREAPNPFRGFGTLAAVSFLFFRGIRNAMNSKIPNLQVTAAHSFPGSSGEYRTSLLAIPMRSGGRWEFCDDIA